MRCNIRTLLSYQEARPLDVAKQRDLLVVALAVVAHVADGGEGVALGVGEADRERHPVVADDVVGVGEGGAEPPYGAEVIEGRGVRLPGEGAHRRGVVVGLHAVVGELAAAPDAGAEDASPRGLAVGGDPRQDDEAPAQGALVEGDDALGEGPREHRDAEPGEVEARPARERVGEQR